MSDVATGPGWELRCGRWQDVLSDVECDLLCVDAPYSDRTHSGHASAAGVVAAPGEPRDNKVRRQQGLDACRRPIAYHPWSDADVGEFVAHWSPRTRGWFVTITDHVLSTSWESYLKAFGRYVFPPLPLVERGSRVRLSGDGPSNWTCWIVVARPTSREFATWGTLPGEYSASCERGRAVVGGKPLSIMRSIIRDYSRPGKLVADPCSGEATTLLAALQEGRAAIGSEAMAEHFAIAKRRLERGYTAPLPFTEARPAPEQAALFAAESEE
jgi:hypothetical protein